MSEPRLHIEEIQNDRKSLSNRNLSLVTGSIKIIKKVFPERSHFLMEFVQNADDTKSKSIKIEINEKDIRVFDDGECFSPENVESICDIGHSSKTPNNYMGYLGVDFKSVFLASDCPKIYSGDYQFKFKKPLKNPDNAPWQVTPVWINELLDIQDENWSTAFIIPNTEGADKKITQKIEEDLSPENLSNRIILSLRNIDKIEIHDKIKGIKRKIIKSNDKHLSKIR